MFTDCVKKPKKKTSFLDKVTLITRNWHRKSYPLGSIVPRKSSFLVESDIAPIIHSFADGLIYPKGDRILDDDCDTELLAAVVSSDGKYCLTSSDDGYLTKWLLSVGKKVNSWRGYRKAIEFVDSCSGLCASASGKTLCIWDEMTGDLIRKLEGHDDLVNTVSFNQDGTSIISASEDETIRVWSVKSGECTQELVGHTGCVLSAFFMKNEIISASSDRSIKLWDPNTGECLRTVTEGIRISIFGLAVFEGGPESYVICRCMQSTVIYKYPSMEIRYQIRGPALSACFNPSNPHRIALVTDNGNRVKIYDISDECLCIFNRKSYMIRHVCFTPDGQLLISVSDSVNVWDVSQLDVPIRDLSFSEPADLVDSAIVASQPVHRLQLSALRYDI